MNWHRVKVIVRNDLKQIMKVKQVVLPMLFVPLLMTLLMPGILLASLIHVDSAEINQDNQEFAKLFPAELLPAGLSVKQQAVYGVSVYFYVPFFLLVPVMIAGVIAAVSFVGEKEKKTIEGLLYTPVTNGELMLAKIGVALVPALVISYLSFAAYTVLVNVLGAPVLGYVFFPTFNWMIVMVLLVPSISFLSLSVIIAISERAKSVWEAQQLSGLLVLPIVGLLISQATGLLALTWQVLIGLGGLIVMIDYGLYRLLVHRFNREYMVTKLV